MVQHADQPCPQGLSAAVSLLPSFKKTTLFISAVLTTTISFVLGWHTGVHSDESRVTPTECNQHPIQLARKPRPAAELSNSIGFQGVLSWEGCKISLSASSYREYPICIGGAAPSLYIRKHGCLESLFQEENGFTQKANYDLLREKLAFELEDVGISRESFDFGVRFVFRIQPCWLVSGRP
ncbi:PREDICTED: uncharacterized protein LOC105555273 [Mandrillus leucophaeus]|uniref:uncharacterized protein LOC105555273 n=1 Tax=Mandrillus leucophaeus TaxID=9568 RepID=UPI0005F5397A|nr:PREDICTED: uncharacterized protein LOC105555273 [Mandrillus leucophaeus]